MARFKQANYLDCRIVAFIRLIGGMDLAPDFLFMDLDLGTLLTMEKLDEALTCTLSNIKEKLDGVPSVIWSGVGYHIYQPYMPCTRGTGNI